ncbi:hypothetical protein ACH41H_35240 [Streptomyces sp. NPDC020800]|uniref:hypothetical protein n=1 Tax=Streptomyces sp. NPDC020800 TaxID=3365092 RepID=UPI0037A092BD
MTGVDAGHSATGARQPAGRCGCRRPRTATGRAAVTAVGDLSGAVGIKRPLRALGADRALLPAIAAGAVADAVTKNAPRLPRESEVLEILTLALDGAWDQEPRPRASAARRGRRPGSRSSMCRLQRPGARW